MRRTQLYLDDQLWNVLHARARAGKTTISELVRRAVRERYFGNQDERRNAMQAIVGIRKTGTDAPVAVDYVRTLRRSTRLERLSK
jgi:hypothetical protein